MKPRTLVAIAILSIAVGSSPATGQGAKSLPTLPVNVPPPDPRLAVAAKRIRRLKPLEFGHLPSSVIAYLDKRGCTVPQADGVRDQPNNVITGKFTSASSEDIAVLCSAQGVSKIVVFRGGATSGVAELEPRHDIDLVQVVRQDTVEFSRVLGVAHADAIRTYHKEFGGASSLPSVVDHDGIEDITVDKASGIHYWFRGKWWHLAGMD